MYSLSFNYKCCCWRVRMETKEVHLNPIPYKVTNIYQSTEPRADRKSVIMALLLGLLAGYIIGQLVPLGT